MDTFTVGTVVTILVVPVLLAVALGAAVYFWLRSRRESAAVDRTSFRWLSVGAVGAAVVVAVVSWWGMYPWRAEYHEWREVSGVVEFIDSRMLPAEGGRGVEDKFVVIFEGSPQQYGVLDTRAASARPGDTLTITCVRQYQRAGTHGYDCNFVSLVKSPRSKEDQERP